MERIETLDRTIPLLLKESAKFTAFGAASGFVLGLALRRPLFIMILSAGIAAGHSYRLSNSYLQNLKYGTIESTHHET